MNNVRPKIVILAVYKTKEGDRRGFCAPYDVSTNAPTTEEALSNLEKLVELYEEGLEQYGYPEHLAAKDLTDSEDKEVFNQIRPLIANQIQKKMREEFLEYELERQERNEFTLQGVEGYYFEPVPA